MSYDAEKLSADAWKVIGVVILGPFMTQMDSTIVNGLETASRREPGAWALVPGVCLCVLFGWHAAKNRGKALVELDLFKIRVFSYATVTMFLGNGILYAGQFLIPLYLTLGCHLSASQAGWILSSMGLGM